MASTFPNGTLAPTMRQVHRAGDKAFVGFSGKRPTIVDATTGEIVPVELFVGALGASRYVYAEACPPQDLPSWITAHTRMLEFFGGAPAIVVPDHHVDVEHNYYRVPHQILHQRVEVRLTATVVEAFLQGRRIASHRRRHGCGEYATDPAHMPHSIAPPPSGRRRA